MVHKVATSIEWLTLVEVTPVTGICASLVFTQITCYSIMMTSIGDIAKIGGTKIIIVTIQSTTLATNGRIASVNSASATIFAIGSVGMFASSSWITSINCASIIIVTIYS
jgi:hypothetical protein